MIWIGTAGWAIPRRWKDLFPIGPTGLQRYAARLNCAEINSTFYRSHRPATYARWAASVPDGFRFAVKMPKAITHEQRLIDVEPLLDIFIGETKLLGETLGPILVQFPPSFSFESKRVGAFLALLRERTDGPVACEPRHPTWFDEAASAMLIAYRIARVAADPARFPEAGKVGGWPDLAYFRWHGSPRMYFSPYDPSAIASLAAAASASVAHETWCIFDNTGSGAAAGDALALQAALRHR